MNQRMILTLSCFLYSGVIRAVTLALAKEPKHISRSLSVSETRREDEIFLEMAKRYILQRLDMKDRPDTSNVTLKSAQVSVLRRLHTGTLLSDGSVDDFSSELRTERSQGSREHTHQIITFAKSVWVSPTETKLSFLLSNEGNEGSLTVVQQAELWVHFKSFPPEPYPGPSPGRDQQTISLKIFLKRQGGVSRTLICDRRFEVNANAWHAFPVTDVVQDFLEKREYLLDFELECRVRGNNGSVGPFGLDVDDQAKQPFLASRLRVSQRISRLRKRGIECAEKLNLCCRREFYVDFRAIGWDDWIVVPKGYHANHCLGTCLPHMAGAPSVASSYHATVTNLYKINNLHPVLTLNSCCVPTRRSGLPMLYFDEQRRIIRRDIPDMVIDECGCA
ncbi:inhibin beta B chain isoform X1 [Callorhinchus milii]|uniref:inhibin beta B chain isoform X1 n=2 Tax=Callorhinchus milii TaxID=7868 RepID=UPI001C3FBE66|nr:inhibin beta B chain isoform X1 [Callorhinchus milii]XP_007909637.2 inhibin beta B chain isoform X1 [Callorhinchus milii]XP_042200240.1 inhibin beta B chain isoform X1 [Callorhinchus milii]